MDKWAKVPVNPIPLEVTWLTGVPERFEKWSWALDGSKVVYLGVNFGVCGLLFFV